jgi:hypothetical protein
MSFDVWKTFSKLLLNHRETTLRNMRYREAIESPRSPLAIYTSPLVSVSYEFITILSITIDFSLPELVKLSEVPNLGVLEIINTSGRDLRIVSDRLIRAWNIAALTDGAFKILRILRLWNHIGVTSKSLVYLNSFPALGVYDVRGCGFDISSPIHARRLGWKPTVDRNILNVLHAACVERAITLRAKLGLNPQPVRRASSEQLWDGAKVWKLPRTDVAAFLTRDETSRPGTPRCRLSYSTMNNIVDHLERNHPTAESRLGRSRWEALDSYLFKVSRSKMTWDFQLYSAYARLGELRDDRDLRRAGVDIGDQAMVGNELVNSVPTVSIRLGQTAPELRPSSPAAMTPKPLYGSVLASSSSSSLNRLASGPDFDPKAMCFIRVEAPSKAEISALQASLGKDKKTESHETEPSQKRKSRASMMENKKMKLGDVLGSFL